MKNNKLIYPGGIAFYNDDEELSTGCCFDLNDIKIAYNDIKNHKHTWLGHDPDELVNFIDNKTIIFESNNLDINTAYENTKVKILIIPINKQ